MRFRNSRLHSLLIRLRMNQDGSTAIEFAVVGGVLIFFVLGILGLSLYFLANSSLQSGVETASRIIRTGQSNEAKMNISSFREAVCKSMNATIDCKKLSIVVNAANDWSDLTLAPCVVNGTMSASTGNPEDLLSAYAGKEEQVVVVTVCYRWEMAKNFPFLQLSNSGDSGGAAILQAATAFRAEPYN